VELDEYRELLVPLARSYGVEPGRPRPDDDDWQAKLDVVADTVPDVVSFTFGCPAPDVMARLRRRGVLSMVTVTSRTEAQMAVAAGAGALAVQGPAAGGHRGVFAADAPAPEQGLSALLAHTVGLGVPVVAAGGLGDAAAVRAVLTAGAAAAQVGTALLLSDEAGTSVVHRRALRDKQFTGTVVKPETLSVMNMTSGYFFLRAAISAATSAEGSPSAAKLARRRSVEMIAAAGLENRPFCTPIRCSSFFLPEWWAPPWVNGIASKASKAASSCGLAARECCWVMRSLKSSFT
jgi:NAD(P)H-dependent flavin oxidoreductase YrpB (nitropropane dioxygenase family)